MAIPSSLSEQQTTVSAINVIDGLNTKRTCLNCGIEMPANIRKDAKFHEAKCRYLYWHKQHPDK